MSYRSFVSKTVGPSNSVNENDVLNVKSALNAAGYYAVPSHGIGPYPDTPMFDGMKRFQRDHGLRVDGVMKPGGPTERTLSARLGGDVRQNGIVPTDTLAVDTVAVVSKYLAAVEGAFLGRGRNGRN